MRRDSITYCDVSFVRFANATRMESLAFSQAYDSSRSCWRVGPFEGASPGGPSLTAIQDDRSLSRAFSPTIVFSSSDTACLYTVLNFRGPREQQCPQLAVRNVSSRWLIRGQTLYNDDTFRRDDSCLELKPQCALAQIL